jgi:hypothetical protein
VLWLLFSGSLGFASPRRPWLWAVLIGPWLSLKNLVLRVAGRPGWVHPSTYTTILVLLPVSLIVCSVGAYGGAWLRRTFLPPERSLESGTSRRPRSPLPRSPDHELDPGVAAPPPQRPAGPTVPLSRSPDG